MIELSEEYYKNNPRSWIQTVENEGFAGHLVHVDPDTVGQYTGLKDKSGNLVYENDIVNCKTKSYLFEGYTIEWHNDDARFVMVKNGRRYAVSESFEYEIVGKITDNHDMLTDK